MKVFFNLLLIGFLISSCSDDGEISTLPGPSGDSLVIQPVFNSLSFNRPVDLQHFQDDLFVVEQQGVIQIFQNDENTSSSSVFLDITDRVDNSDNEEGLLGLAFHPGFGQNGFFYVNYTSFGSTTRISRFETDPQDDRSALADSELILMEFSQPFGNHNGGQIAFGPDGLLYIAVGDGGSAGDPRGNSQNTSTLLGNILRIDVDNPTGNLNYGIPADNPFVGNQDGDREEIFAFGLRNPWRMSFDVETGRLWTGDVGQNSFEEIDIVENGGNYGWRIMEAAECFQANCDPTGLILPYFQYGRSSGTSITGGYVYRGSITDLLGYYIYADFNTGRIWALESDATNPENNLLFDTSVRITTFGIDNQNELYFCGIDGSIFKFAAL